MILHNQIKESIDLVVCIFQHLHSYSAHSVWVTHTRTLNFVYLYIFILIYLQTFTTWRVFTCFNMNGGWLRKSFHFNTKHVPQTKNKKYSTFLGIYSCNSKRKSCGMCEHTHILCRCEREPRFYTVPTVRVNLHSRVRKHSKYSFCTQCGSMFITRWCFFTVYANGLHSFTVIRHFCLHHLHFTYVSFLLAEIPFVWSMHTALAMRRSWSSFETHASTQIKLGFKTHFDVFALSIEKYIFPLLCFVRSIRFLFCFVRTIYEFT